MRTSLAAISPLQFSLTEERNLLAHSENNWISAPDTCRLIQPENVHRQSLMQQDGMKLDELRLTRCRSDGQHGVANGIAIVFVGLTEGFVPRRAVIARDLHGVLDGFHVGAGVRHRRKRIDAINPRAISKSERLDMGMDLAAPR